MTRRKEASYWTSSWPMLAQEPRSPDLTSTSVAKYPATASGRDTGLFLIPLPHTYPDSLERLVKSHRHQSGAQ